MTRPLPYLEVIVGPMFAAKSTEMLQRIRRALRARLRIDVAIPQLDSRSAGRIKTHNGETSEDYQVPVRVIPTTTSGGAPEASSLAWYATRDLQATNLFVDEFQFFDAQFPVHVERLLAGGVSVTVAGLDLDSDGNVFGSAGALLALATRVTKLTGVCECGRDAVRTHCRVPKGVVLVGAAEYEPLCLACWASRRSP